MLFVTCINTSQSFINISPDKVLETVSHQASVVQWVDNAIHWINHHPVDGMVCFVNNHHWIVIFSVDEYYPAFQQLGPRHL